MKIQKITWRNRRDFEAIYECEHCGATRKCGGYDDDNFHVNVIPNMKCNSCEKKGSDNYKPMATKYKSHEII
jgi:primosomal protein N'